MSRFKIATSLLWLRRAQLAFSSVADLRLMIALCLCAFAHLLPSSAQTPAANDTALAWRNEAGYITGGTNGWPGMPYSLWTNCVFALSPEIPVVNSGSTNALWLDWSSVRTNSRQAALDLQPVRILTNGIWAFSFDGLDDYLTSLPAISSTNFTIHVEFLYGGIASAVTAQTRLFSQASVYQLTISRPGQTVQAYVSSAATNTGFFSSGETLSTGSVYTATLTVDRPAAVAKLYVNGIFKASATIDTNAYSSGQASALACYSGTGTANFLGQIRKFLIFNRAFSSNEVWSLSK